ncbi:MAG TPA: hypothetical protein PKD28_02790 [Candidatus Saccharibacteria bacterium]|nr:hypothetical protein [Candidatus Saccharibacteria bacterium]
MWFTSNAGSYFDTNVVVSHNASSVTIYLRGSVWPCGSNISGATHAVGVRIQEWHAWGSDTDSTPRPLDGRFSGYTPGSDLYRGDFQGNGSHWTSQGGSIAATLNLSSIPVNNTTSNQTHTMVVGLWRRYSDTTGLGSSYATPMTVTITRTGRPIQWTINGQSYIKKNSSSDSARVQGENASTASPSDVLRWDHDLRNNGPDNMDRNVTINVDRQDRRLSDGSQLSFNSNPSGMTGRGNVNQLFHTSYNIAHSVVQGDVGEKLCQRIAWNNAAWNNTGWGTSGYACANIPYNYTLVPSVTGSIPSTAEAGQQINNIQGRITSTGPTKSYPSDIRYIRVVNPTNLNGSDASGAAACPRYGSSGSRCAILHVTGENNRVFNHGSGDSGGAIVSGTNYAQPVGSDILPDSLQPGDTVCYALAVTGYHNTNGSAKSATRYSDIQSSHCTKIGKNPKVQVWGGNVSVGQATIGGSINTNASIHSSTTTKATGLTYGSWGEYALFAPRVIGGTASASGLNNGNSSDTQSNWSRLTFTGNNPSSPGVYGSYTYGMTSLPNIAARFPLLTAAPFSGTTLNAVTDANSATQGNRVIGSTATASLNITGTGQVQPGRWLVIHRPNSDVTITSNIEYTGGNLSNIDQIPQIVIIARNITIASNVTRVDAWLVASRDIATCNEGGDATNLRSTYTAATTRLTTAMCNQALTINGPVIADKLYLRRTAGSGTGPASGDPAETINFRADAYLWAQRNGLDDRASSPFHTVSIQELPPRY